MLDLAVSGEGAGVDWEARESDGRGGWRGPAGKMSTGIRDLARCRTRWGMGVFKSWVAHRTPSSHATGQWRKEGKREANFPERSARVVA